jgi:hypothetical protein
VVENLVALDLDAMEGESSGVEWGDDTGGVEWDEIGGAATGVGSELNVDAQPGGVAVGATLGVGAVNTHTGFVDGPVQVGIGAFGTEGNVVGSGSVVSGSGEEEFSVSDFSDLPILHIVLIWFRFELF